MNNRIKLVLKFIFAISLIIWLVDSGRLDFGLVKRALTENPWWPLALLLLIFDSFLSSVRWRALLHSHSKKTLSIFEVFKITWIGMFFNTFLPGSVSGDLVKLVYAKDLDTSLSKTFLVLTALLDRVLGLMGLIFVMGAMGLLSVLFAQHNLPTLQRFLPFNMALFAAALFFIGCLFAPKKIQSRVISIFQKIPLLGEHLSNTLQQTWRIGASKKLVFFALFLSSLIQFGGVLVFWLLTSPFFETNIPFLTLFTFIPIGLISTAIPISPAGLGVGHFVFEGLFKLVGVSGGASLFNIFFMAVVSVNFLGLIPYILHKKPLPDFEEDSALLDKRSPL